jgi:hypothetical protein
MAAIACSSCVVSFFIKPAGEVSDEMVGVIHILAESGLTPPLQFEARGA